MGEQLDRSKLYSGKYLLAVSCAICILLLTLSVCMALFLDDADGTRKEVLLVIIALLSNIFTGISVNYFTKRAQP